MPGIVGWLVAYHYKMMMMAQLIHLSIVIYVYHIDLYDYALYVSYIFRIIAHVPILNL